MKPTTYLDWVRVTAKGCLLSWRNLPAHSSDAWRSFKEFAYDFEFVLLALVLPLLTPFAPIVALVLRHFYRLREERAAAQEKAWRDELTKNCQWEDE